MSILARVSILSVLVSLSGCGDGLSREDAEKAIEERLNEAKEFPTVSLDTGDRFFIPPAEPYALESVCPSLMKTGQRATGGFVPRHDPGGPWTDWEAAREAGFIAVSAQMFYYRDLGRPFTAIKCMSQLTDKAKEYVVENDFFRGTILKAVEAVEVTVTGVTKPAEMVGHTLSEVEYTITYKLNPLGQALAGSKEAEDEQKHRAAFQLFDDGWRLEGL